MSTYAVQGETLGLIADAIRGKLGTDEQMEVSSFASAIESISGGGGLPDWLEIETGEYKPYAIVPASTLIPHSMGVIPDVVYVEAFGYENASQSIPIALGGVNYLSKLNTRDFYGNYLNNGALRRSSVANNNSTKYTRTHFIIPNYGDSHYLDPNITYKYILLKFI